jgi:16S rRNA (cytosine1402-N4)-methyltransferase
MTDDGTRIVHVPVCLDEVLSLLAPAPGHVLVDGTCGEGGHAERLLEATEPGGRVIGVDRDPDILAVARRRLARFGARFHAVHGDSGVPGDLERAVRSAGLEPGGVDGVLFDFGISSYHFEHPERGFAFEHDGPLDMRLDQHSDAPTLADRLKRVRQDELQQLLRDLGDVRTPGRIARAIVEARNAGTLSGTAALARVVEAATPAPAKRASRIHPATRTFMALRIWVNGELERLPIAFDGARAVLRPGGRVVAIAFHSGEDRVVKNVVRDWHRDKIAQRLTTKPLVPTPEECAANPRARSAKVRGARLLPLPEGDDA